jgi:hypothetical protein
LFSEQQLPLQRQLVLQPLVQVKQLSLEPTQPNTPLVTPSQAEPLVKSSQQSFLAPTQAVPPS